MCQESLIEYLSTHLLSETTDADAADFAAEAVNRETKADIEQLVRRNVVSARFAEYKRANGINNLLKQVKICDPAIGSGAFPMGLLKEIFECRRVLYGYLKTNETFNPATIKKEIIQNNIYGVDLEPGAVDIARLRFWLALVVDEIEPSPLPNLDYKIMQGNSLLERFEDIDLSNLVSADGDETGEVMITEQQQFGFAEGLAHSEQMQLTVFDQATKEQLQNLIGIYFDLDEWNRRTNQNLDKADLKQQINDVVEGKIHAFIFAEKQRLKAEVRKYEKKWIDAGFADFSKLSQSSKEFKAYLAVKRKFEQAGETEMRLISMQHKPERPYFLWHLWFKDVFERGGFDIVIGNPPYVDYRLIERTITTNQKYVYTNEKSVRPNLYLYFIELSDAILNDKGVLSFINPNQFLSTDSGIGIRELLLENRRLISFDDVSYIDVFKAAATYTTIWFFSKARNQNNRIKINRCTTLDELGGLLFDINQKEITQSTKWLIPISKEYQLISEIEKTNVTRLENVCTMLWGTSASGYGKLKIPFDDYSKLNQSQKLNYLPIIQTADIKKLYIDWQEEFIPKSVYSSKILAQFKKDKVVVARLTKQIQSAFDSNKYAVGKSTIIVDSSINLKIITAIINSRLAFFWYYNKYETTHMSGGYLRVDIPYLEQLPLPNFKGKNIDKKFEIFIDYLTFLHDKTKPAVNQFADNKSIAAVFEDALNMMVYELYFEAHLKENELDVLQFVDTENVFRDISRLSDDAEKARIIGAAYTWLQASDNPIRNRALLANIRSPDIIRKINSSTH